MSLIKVVNIEKEYKGKFEVSVKAVRGVNFEIKEGEFAAIVGPSGSGKSTILNMLGCLDVPTSGDIIIHDRDVHNLRAAQQSKFRREYVGFIFQSYNLLPVLSVSENISFPLTLLNLSRTEIKHRVDESLKAVGLFELAHRRPNELSGGQQQRVAIARALAKKPKIVFADEPTANLDSKTGEEVLDLMKTLNKEHGMTFIFSTHDPMVMEYANRIITLQDGEVVTDEYK